MGVNVNAMLAAFRDVEVRGFRNYGSAYTMSFDASAGDTIRVWMYSPAAPGYVVIDDASVMLDRTLVVTEGEWTIGYPGRLAASRCGAKNSSSKGAMTAE